MAYSEGKGMTNQIPENLELNESVVTGFNLNELQQDDPAYREIEIDFNAASLRIIKVEKLINDHLRQRYLTELKLLLEQRSTIDPDFKLNEKYLYHGTKAQKANLCEEGLDSRISKQGCFGRGIYFSDYPKKCTKYAEKGGGDEHFILLMRVILGESKIYPNGVKDTTLVREPEKTAPFKGHRFYDSVKGCPVNHQEFVVYDSRRALVEYIITYKRENADGTVETDGQPVRNLASRRDSDQSTDNSTYDDDDDDDDTGNDEEHSSKDHFSDDEEAEISKSLVIPKDLKDIFDFDKYDYDKLLNEKKAEFTQQTNSTNEEIIDHCLLRANMDVDEAVKLYKEHGDGILEVPLPEVPKEFEEEFMKMMGRPQHPEPGTDEWNALSEEQKEAIITTIINDFLFITGLSEQKADYAREKLAESGNILDLAIMSHYDTL